MSSSSYSYLIDDPDLILTLKTGPDNFLIDKNSGYDIENARALTRWVNNKPFSRNYKLALIRNAENLSPEAQNTLLKTIEEPPANTFIFLTTRNMDRLLPTVISRCERISLDQLKKKQLSHTPEEKRDQLGWLENLVWEEPSKNQSELPELSGKRQALVQAEKLAQRNREELQETLNGWLNITIRQDKTENILIANAIVDALECLGHNTNRQLTLEVLFLKIVKINNQSGQSE